MLVDKKRESLDKGKKEPRPNTNFKDISSCGFHLEVEDTREYMMNMPRLLLNG